MRLASEGIILFDQGGIKGLFREIKKAAKKAGLVEQRIGKHRVWSFKEPRLEEVEVKVKDEKKEMELDLMVKRKNNPVIICNLNNKLSI